jgi:hypothetical protein
VTREPSRWATAALLGLILLVGGALRFTNVDWDEGAHLNPDERFLTMVNAELSGPDSPAGYFDTDASPLNPGNTELNFVYGTAPVFAVKGIATWLHHGAVDGSQPARASSWAGPPVPLLDGDGGRRSIPDTIASSAGDSRSPT